MFKVSQKKGKLNTSWTSHDSEACILCDRIAPASDLQQVMTVHPNNRLHECATTLSDGKLLARMNGGDASAQELKYHCTCVTGETSHLKSPEKSSYWSEVEPDVYPLVFSELVNQMVNGKNKS